MVEFVHVDQLRFVTEEHAFDSPKKLDTVILYMGVKREKLPCDPQVQSDLSAVNLGELVSSNTPFYTTWIFGLSYSPGMCFVYCLGGVFPISPSLWG
jgi:hypothetical protein